MEKLPLLMTASVNTHGMPLARFSPEEREEMYLQVLRFYCRELLSKGNYTLVFAENSGWDLSKVKAAIPEEYRAQTEFLSFDASHFDVSRGKSFNEVLLIEAAIAQSSFLQHRGAFLKVTGRYPVKNIRYFLDYGSREILQNGKQLYIDIKDHGLYAKLGLSWCSHFADVRLFGISNPLFLLAVAPQKDQLNDSEGKMLEGLMYNLVKSRQNDPHMLYRFRWEPRYGGREGALINAFAYAENQSSLKSRVKRWGGNVLRIVAPDFLF